MDLLSHKQTVFIKNPDVIKRYLSSLYGAFISKARTVCSDDLGSMGQRTEEMRLFVRTALSHGDPDRIKLYSIPRIKSVAGINISWEVQIYEHPSQATGSQEIKGKSLCLLLPEKEATVNCFCLPSWQGKWVDSTVYPPIVCDLVL